MAFHAITARAGALALFAAALCLPISLRAGAWTREAGEAYAKIALSHYEADEIFAAKGNNKIDGPDFTDDALSVYGEYGLTPAWTGIASMAMKTLRSENPGIVTRREAGPGDAWVFLKRALLRGPVVLSIQGGVKIPLGYDERTIPPLGDGQIDYEARVLAGRSFFRGRSYGNAEIGFRKRNGDFSDEFPYRLEGGIFLGRPALVTLSLDGVSNATNDTASKAPGRAPHVFDEEYQKLGSSLILFVGGGAALEAFYEQVIAGGNTSAGRTIGLGVSWQGRIRGR